MKRSRRGHILAIILLLSMELMGCRSTRSQYQQKTPSSRHAIRRRQTAYRPFHRPIGESKLEHDLNAVTHSAAGDVR